MKKLLLASLGLITVAALLFARGVRRAEREAVAACIGIAKQQTRTMTAVEHAQSRISVAERTTAELRQKLEALKQKMTSAALNPPATSANSAATKSNQAPSSEVAARRKELEAVAKTKGQIATLAEDRLRFANVYQSLFRALRLSPEQIEQFMAISARQHERVMDLGQMEREGLIAKDDPAIARIRAEGVAAEHAAYRELFGESGYRQFIEDQKKTTAREIIGGFGARALMTGMPISADKLEQLVEAVAASQIPNIGWRQSDGRFATWQFDPIDWDVADVRVRPLLSDAEWTLYKSQAVARAEHRLRSVAYQVKRADDAQRKAGSAAKGPGS
ncbi:MAG: hypothetical protein EXS32_04795 [Opitutus sp.]|nr:hypothetical protein [Opitutus sp.]